jgi:hypothetical protein
LRSLDLSQNRLGVRTGAALAGSPYLGKLTHLDVTSCAIGSAARAQLEARFGKEALSPRS